MGCKRCSAQLPPKTSQRQEKQRSQPRARREASLPRKPFAETPIPRCSSAITLIARQKAFKLFGNAMLGSDRFSSPGTARATCEPAEGSPHRGFGAETAKHGLSQPADPARRRDAEAPHPSPCGRSHGARAPLRFVRL